MPLQAQDAPTRTQVQEEAGLWGRGLQKQLGANTLSFHPECAEETKEAQLHVGGGGRPRGLGNHGAPTAISFCTRSETAASALWLFSFGNEELRIAHISVLIGYSSPLCPAIKLSTEPTSEIYS